MLDIKGAVAVITGGSGMALAHKWLELGGKAVIAESALQTAKSQLGKGVETYTCNVTNAGRKPATQGI